MHDILKEILSKRMMYIEAVKAGYSDEERRAIYKEARSKKRRIRLSFKEALVNCRSERAIIAEFKRASPSKGDINVEADARAQALRYEKSGAAAMSILTEPEYFKGRLQDIRDVSQVTTLPILCKDFIVDAIQIDFAKLSGADAVLLIVGALNEEKLRSLYQHARSLDLDVLMESHNQIELMKALKLKDAIIGINNRNLKTFKTDIQVTERLMALIPQGRLVVSESGIRSVEDMDYLKSVGAGAYLVGETLMNYGGVDLKNFFGAPGHPKIKMCGLSRQSDIRIANELNVDYVGFVFAKSKRKVDVQVAKRLIHNLSRNIKAVGVFVDREPEDVQRIAEVCGLDIVQLHGHEDLERYKLDRPVWKAMAVKAGARDSEQNLGSVSRVPAGVVYDTYDPKMSGGTGKSFPWVNTLPPSSGFRIAAGGISGENVETCIKILDPDIIDISSSIETGDNKDPEKMRQFEAVVTAYKEAEVDG